MVEFQVDIEALGQLAYQLAVIHDALAGARANLGAGQVAVGSPIVSAALGSFGSGWRDGRSSIEGEVSSLSAAAEGVAADYLRGEQVLTGTFASRPDPAVGAASGAGGHGVR
jgi:hypothetical protein